MQKSKHSNVYTDERDTTTIETESHHISNLSKAPFWIKWKTNSISLLLPLKRSFIQA